MIGFSDEQLAALTAAASRIEHGKRNSFLRRVAAELAKARLQSGKPVGDAELSRAITSVERAFSVDKAA